jgi:hypothetical protein
LSSIFTYHDKYSKDEVRDEVINTISKEFESEKFKNRTIYYEFFHKLFPKIEHFTFDEFRSIKFLNYLLELFPEIVALNYKGQRELWRLTDVELEERGDDNHGMRHQDRMNSHNALYYNLDGVPCFYPSIIGQRNYEEYKLQLPGIYTPLFKLEKFKMRNVENTLRVKRSLPKIGEGWISESLLFHRIKEAFPNELIISHGKTEWLGAQHLDIYFPELNIAIEYQGIQHQKPVEYFGGEEAFIRGQERDLRKKKLCQANDCALLYVYPGYNERTILDQLEALIKAKRS